MPPLGQSRYIPNSHTTDNTLVPDTQQGREIAGSSTFRDKGLFSLEELTTTGNNGRCRNELSETKDRTLSRDVGSHSNLECGWKQTDVTVQLSWKDKILSWRYVIVLMLHLSFFTNLMIKGAMPLALVCMADPSPSTLDDTNQTDNITMSNNRSQYQGWDDSSQRIWNRSRSEYEFHWDLETQGLILTAVSFTAWLCPFLIQILRPKIGSKNTSILFATVAAILNCLIPLSARLTPWLVFTNRLVLGLLLVGGMMITVDILSWWAPAMEKQTMASFATAGANIGGIVSSLIAGFLCHLPVDNGWPFIFYIFGFLNLMTAISWYFLVTDKPESHPYISESERRFIVNNRNPVDSGQDGVRVPTLERLVVHRLGVSRK